MSDRPLYPKHSPWDLEPHYCRHVSHMTSEGLHAKADIAVQLAARDQRIEQLEAERNPEERAHLLKAAELCWQALKALPVRSLPDGSLAWLDAEQKRRGEP